jgi:hypothetical protein
MAYVVPLVKKIISTIHAIFHVLIIYVFGLITLGFGYLLVVRPIFDQLYSGLKTGEFPSRDLHWAVAPVSCSATSYQPEGFRGMDVCREDYIYFTSWIGLDKILNLFSTTYINSGYFTYHCYMGRTYENRQYVGCDYKQNTPPELETDWV